MKKREKVAEGVVTIVFAAVCIIMLLPFVMMVSTSFSADSDITKYGYSLVPRSIDLSGYRYVFINPASILSGYKVTILFSTVATILGVFLMALIAYPLSRNNFNGKKFVNFYLYFTMLFSGGLVPTYILITKYLHLNNTIWVYILPSLISPWYIFMMRTFFKDIPEAICESARIDGASEFRIFTQMILPLSKPVLATVALFTFLAKWNSWQEAMLYIDDTNLMSLQYLLQRIMQNIQLLQQSSEGSVNQLVSASDIPAESARMAMAVIVA